ncbi:MAG TPA: GntP family permease [Nocardioidaceae bacterium]|nr:GntP family permease [Nocardioidaceae bacterium]
MDPMEPVYSTATLLLIAAAAVAVLLFLIIKVRLHAFLALVLVSLLTALAAGVPIADVPAVLLSGFGSTLASVALLVALGAMLGRLLEVTGGAQILADTLISRFGEHRAPFALGVASLLFGFPIFFDAGLVVFLPIILTVARRFGGSLLFYALPAAGAFAAMHAIVPPHPGPVTAADLIGANVGLTTLIGIPVAVVTWYVGSYLFSKWAGRKFDIDIPASILGDVNEGIPGERGRTASFPVVLSMLLLPLLLITLNTVITTLATTGVVDEEAGWVGALKLVGQTPVALLITVLVAIWALGLRSGRSNDEVEGLLNQALGPICAIILITGAGGMFGGVLRYSGIGNALAESLDAVGLPLIIAAFVISTGLRVAQGSATVALTTTAGLIAPAVAATEGLSSIDLVALVFAIAAGATVLSHVNDSGFWLVSRFFGMDEKTTLKTWTVMETTLGLTAFVLSLLLWFIF